MAVEKTSNAVSHLAEARAAFTSFTAEFARTFTQKDPQHKKEELDEIIGESMTGILLPDPHAIHTLLHEAKHEPADFNLNDLVYGVGDYDFNFKTFTAQKMGSWSAKPTEELEERYQWTYYKSKELLKRAGLLEYCESKLIDRGATWYSNSKMQEFCYLVNRAAHNAHEMADSAFSGKPAGGWLDWIAFNNAKGIMFGPTADSGSLKSTFAPFTEVASIVVGEYGEAFARKLFMTMQRLLSHVPNLEQASAEFAKDPKNREMLLKTARGAYENPNDPSLKRVALITLQEGILSLAQTIALMTEEKQEAYPDPDELVRDLLLNHLPNTFAYSVPPAIIGPCSLIGRTMKGLIDVPVDSKTGEKMLQIHPHLRDRFLQVKKHFKQQDFMDARVRLLNPDALPAVFRGCPISFPAKNSDMTGIQMLDCLFLSEYESIS